MGFSVTAGFAVVCITFFICIQLLTGNMLPAIIDYYDSYNSMDDRAVYQAQSNVNITGVEETWEYQKLITVDNTKVTDNLVDFPVLISMTDTDLRDKAQSDGDDIMFVSWYDNTTKLDHEIEYYDGTTGELVAWVRVPNLYDNVDTRVWMYYGNLACKSQENIEGVWDSSYKMVHHLNESSGTLYDATLNNNDGANYDASSSASSKIDGGYSLDGTDDWIDVPTSNSLNITTAITVTGWFKLSSLNRYNHIIGKGEAVRSDLDESGKVNDYDFDVIFFPHVPQSGYSPPYPRWDIQNDSDCDINDFSDFGSEFGGSTNMWRVLIGDNDDNGDTKMIFTVSKTSTPLMNSTKKFKQGDVGTWIHFAAVFDGSTASIYINGSLDNSSGSTGSIGTNNQTVRIGRNTFFGDYYDRFFFNGELDEMRISSTPRTAGWLETSYNTMNDPGNFFGVGAEQTGRDEVYLNVTVKNIGSVSLKADSFTLLLNGTNYEINSSDPFLYPEKKVVLYTRIPIARTEERMEVITDNGIPDYYEYSV